MVLAAIDGGDMICSVYIMKRIADSSLQTPWQSLD